MTPQRGSESLAFGSVCLVLGVAAGSACRRDLTKEPAACAALQDEANAIEERHMALDDEIAAWSDSVGRWMKDKANSEARRGTPLGRNLFHHLERLGSLRTGTNFAIDVDDCLGDPNETVLIDEQLQAVALEPRFDVEQRLDNVRMRATSSVIRR